MDSASDTYQFIIPNRELRNQNKKLNTIIIFVIIIIMIILFSWMINIYIKVDDINIYNCVNEIEIDGIDMDYLIEQNHYKQLSTDEAKQKYKQLNNSEKKLDIKKQLIANIMKS
jgi:hypothetical protein